MKKKAICVFIGSRANYSSAKSLMLAIKNHPELKLQLIIGSSVLLERFGYVDNLIEEDGFKPDLRFYSNIEGGNPVTMAKSAGLCTMETALALENLNPHFVVIVGDRFEMMGFTTAAAYMNIRIAHTMGGEVTGTIDESIRHAITKFAHVHFTANEDARERVIKMGEDPEFVFNVGCPRIDMVIEEMKKDSNEILRKMYQFREKGVGASVDVSGRPFLLVSQHSVTTEFGNNRKHIEETLAALERLSLPTIMLWPNIDAGSDNISKGIRTFREKKRPEWLHVFKNLPFQTYIHLMKQTACLVGNSSSGIREGAFIGTPVVNIGSRQSNRMRGENIIDVDYDEKQIYQAIKKQIDHGAYKPNVLYGNGKAGEKIADILSKIEPEIQKQIQY